MKFFNFFITNIILKFNQSSMFPNALPWLDYGVKNRFGRRAHKRYGCKFFFHILD